MLVTGATLLLGVGPAIFLLSGALAAPLAGRAMDGIGRVPVLAGGFGLGIAGSVMTAAAAAGGSSPLVVGGLALIGAANGVAGLARTAAGDMYPASRRARGIAYILFGSVFGSLLGPFVFMPLFTGSRPSAHALTLAWLASAAFMLVGLALVLAVRPDPRRIGELLEAGDEGAPAAEPTAPLGEILRRPGAVPALLGGLASSVVLSAGLAVAGGRALSGLGPAALVLPAAAAALAPTLLIVPGCRRAHALGALC